MGCITKALKIGLVAAAGFGIYKIGYNKGQKELISPTYSTYKLIEKQEKTFLKNKETQNTYLIREINGQDYIGDAQHNLTGAYKIAMQDMNLPQLRKSLIAPQTIQDTINTDLKQKPDSIRLETQNLIDRIKNYF